MPVGTGIAFKQESSPERDIGGPDLHSCSLSQEGAPRRVIR